LLVPSLREMTTDICQPAGCNSIVDYGSDPYTIDVDADTAAQADPKRLLALVIHELTHIAVFDTLYDRNRMVSQMEVTWSAIDGRAERLPFLAQTWYLDSGGR